MNDISMLDARLGAAMDRIAAAHARTRDALRAAQAQPAVATSGNEAAGASEIDALKAELATRSEAAAAEAAELRETLAEERARHSELAARAEADRAALDAMQRDVEVLRATERLETVKDGGLAEEAQVKITRLEQALDRLRAVNGQLRQNNAALRDACAAGVTDASVVNDSLKAELEALQAAREADRAEIDSILSALKPIVEESADA